jgi:hypothetical protein
VKLKDAHMKPTLRLGSVFAAAALMTVAAPASPQAPVAPSRQAVIDELVVANRILANEGVVAPITISLPKPARRLS